MKKSPYTKIFVKFFSLTTVLGLVVLLSIFLGATFGLFGGLDALDIGTLSMDYSTQICYIDSSGAEKHLTNLSSEQNRIWVDLKDIPDDMKNAFIAIEDERFESHNGFDLRRTAKAFFVFVKNKFTGQPTTFGGSTITQQLIKNLTNEKDRTAARKIQEISRAVNLEKKLSKDQILELYLNSIYLSQGCNGVQTASQKFFGKTVGELDLAECASIAGITQYPSLYNPLINPDKNKEKQEIVLKKMLELEYITQDEFEEAINKELVFTELSEDEVEFGVINSYFVDQIINDVIDGLMEKGYSKTLANKMLYSGGLKIIATIDPTVQNAIESVFVNTDNFPYATGDNPAQAAMVVMDPYTGEIKGIVGGIGRKTGNLVLNRASQSLRQPGSTIKPIAVYAPALEDNLINAADLYRDEAISYGGWTPHNYDRTFADANVSIRHAVRRSLNTIPVQILNEYGANKSFNFLTHKLGVTSLVREEKGADGKVYSDIGLSQLALGGLTHGISVVELTAAYTPFINRGIYTKPHCFVKVLDSEGNELLSNSVSAEIAMSESTAYIMSMMLREVVTSGTGGGSQLPSGIFTAGKTGTTSNNNDRWFVGYTPYYTATVWYGYDSPQSIKASGNPCISVWKNVMTQIHNGKPLKSPQAPSGVKYITYCSETGDLPGEFCEETETAFWFTSDNQPKKICTSSHLPEDLAAENNEGEIQTDIETEESSTNTSDIPEISPDVSENAA